MRANESVYGFKTLIEAGTDRYNRLWLKPAPADVAVPTFEVAKAKPQSTQSEMDRPESVERRRDIDPSLRITASDLAKSFTVWALDYPGHGYSDIPKARYNADFFVRTVGSFFDALNLRRRHAVRGLDRWRYCADRSGTPQSVFNEAEALAGISYRKVGSQQ